MPPDPLGDGSVTNDSGMGCSGVGSETMACAGTAAGCGVRRASAVSAFRDSWNEPWRIVRKICEAVARRRGARVGYRVAWVQSVQAMFLPGWAGVTAGYWVP